MTTPGAALHVVGVTVSDAARLAGVPVRTVYTWIADQRLTVRIPPGRRSRDRRVNPVEVQELADLRRDGRLPRLDRDG